jgi:hypothetical protein
MKVSTASVNKAINKVLTNKYVLYFVLFLAVTNVLGYMIMGQFTATIFFILVAYLIYNFSKNMIVVLGGALLFTSILMVGNTIKEGLENAIPVDPNAKKVPTVPVTAPTATTVTASSTPSLTTPTTPSPLSMQPSLPITPPPVSPEESANTPVVPIVNEEAMNVMNSKKRNRIDYATTIENAYGDLNNILGSTGIQKLTDDTQRLMGQQLQLAEAMKSMTPLLENAQSMLQGFDLKNLDGLADLAKSFTSSK